MSEPSESLARRTRAAPSAPAAPQPRAARLKKESAICAEAERQFAQYGFEGASLENIAAAVGISRHNLLYYYPSKEALYRTVLEEVLAEWLARMAGIVSGTDPEAAMREYIAAKLRFSRERPAGSQVFAREVMAGAPRFRDAIEALVLPALNADVKTFERWAREKRIARLDFRHLMFSLWASTQAYADLGPQFAILLGKPALEEGDFEAARESITHQVLAALRPT
ncbi:TetR family transcriptional regulator [Roseateles sp. DAIF2]|uniref:TetR family transcriptional regulator C-terminal domain-containing protein n=1 Tax=Roseateles sp. DAIF2 TaxID=2714952 RepID=UPI0018A2A67A|nr:TetR family transcriptional regulator C-terminal domain-containing protein [Roseateles sp. DAIF2]QPF73411.1 TetR family transcriptional regulator [Roseateles sp. DAIF2]